VRFRYAASTTDKYGLKFFKQKPVVTVMEKQRSKPPRIKEAGIPSPPVHRNSISLSAEQNARFLSLCSHMDVMAHFITACIFQKQLRTTVDKNHGLLCA
jgi:hypothetical protein